MLLVVGWHAIHAVHIWSIRSGTSLLFATFCDPAD